MKTIYEVYCQGDRADCSFASQQLAESYIERDISVVNESALEHGALPCVKREDYRIEPCEVAETINDLPTAQPANRN